MTPSQKPPWPEVRLGDILTERTETPDPGEIETVMIPIVAKISFSEGTIELRDDTRTRTKMILIRPGDLVVSGINAAKGAIAIYDEEDDSPIAATIHYAAYIPDKSRVDVRYLWWLLRSETFRNILKRNLPGGVKTELKAKRLLPIQLPLPPVDEQRRIVARVEELAMLIEEARGLRVKAREEAGALFPSALSEVFSQLFAESVERQSLSAPELCRLVPGQHIMARDYNTDGEGTPYITGPADFGAKFPEVNKWTGDPKSFSLPGDVLVTVKGAGVGKVNCAPDFPLCVGRQVMALRPNDERLIRDYLYHFLLNNYDYFQDVARSTTVPGLKREHIWDLEIPLPSVADQHHIVAYLDSLQAQVDELTALQDATQVELDALLPSVLDRAFRGEL